MLARTYIHSTCRPISFHPLLVSTNTSISNYNNRGIDFRFTREDSHLSTLDSGLWTLVPRGCGKQDPVEDSVIFEMQRTVGFLSEIYPVDSVISEQHACVKRKVAEC